jgi:pimeloyl-ACP methyl ester carboxylesterase
MTFEVREFAIYHEIRNPDADGVPILFIHSALGTHKEFDGLSAFYENRKQILLDLPGHGNSTTTTESLTTGIFAACVRDLIMNLAIYSVDIIGYSMGGYVALELARLAPSMVHSITSHAMKFYWTEAALENSLAQLDSTAIRTRSERAYTKLSEIQSVNGIEKVLAINRNIVAHFRKEKLSEEDIKHIEAPVLFSVGDSDELVSLVEITRLYESQDKKKTFLAIHPGSPHQISKLDLVSFTGAVRIFWNSIVR